MSRQTIYYIYFENLRNIYNPPLNQSLIYHWRPPPYQFAVDLQLSILHKEILLVMKNNSNVPDLSDTALNEHIDDLQAQLDRLTISLQLATAEQRRRSHSDSQSILSQSPNQYTPKQTSKPPLLCVGSKVKITNKYKGNKGRIGEVIELSDKTATVHIPNKGNFVKFLHNLEVLSNPNER